MLAGERLLVRARPWIQIRRTGQYRRAVPPGRSCFSEEDVLYMDNHILCVNKPAGLLSQADRTGDTDVAALAREYVRIAANKPGEAFVATVHRLDRPVSGVMCIARTSKAAARLSASFQARDGVEKMYHAVVAGKLTGRGFREDVLVSSDEGPEGRAVGRRDRGPRSAVVGDAPRNDVTRIQVDALSSSSSSSRGSQMNPTTPQASIVEVTDNDLGHDQDSELGKRDPDRQESGGKMLPQRSGRWMLNAKLDRKNVNSQSKQPIGDRGKLAVLEWEAIDLSQTALGELSCPQSGDPWTVVRVRLVTGRKHQIRVQLAAMGHPIVGDVRYGISQGSDRDRMAYSRGGTARAGDMKALADRSILLHASELAVPHPTRVGEIVRVSAPPPQAWRVACGARVIESVFAQTLVCTRASGEDSG